MTPNERLKTLCADPDLSPHLGRVTQLTADGVRWLFATNGWAFLALLAGPLDDEPEIHEHTAKAARKMIESARAANQSMPWAPLKAFMRVDGPMEVACQNCSGSMEVECPHCCNITECEDCDGGKVPRKAEPVRLLSAHVNRVLFHRFADGLDARTVTYVYGGPKDEVVFADADPERTWALGIMPMVVSEREAAEAPAFEVPA